MKGWTWQYWRCSPGFSITLSTVDPSPFSTSAKPSRRPSSRGGALQSLQHPVDHGVRLGVGLYVLGARSLDERKSGRRRPVPSSREPSGPPSTCLHDAVELAAVARKVVQLAVHLGAVREGERDPLAEQVE